MMAEDLVRRWLNDVETADAEAIRGQAAYLTDRLDEYLEARAAESRTRLEAIYGGEPNTSGADREPGGDGGSGAGGGG